MPRKQKQTLRRKQTLVLGPYRVTVVGGRIGYNITWDKTSPAPVTKTKRTV